LPMESMHVAEAPPPPDIDKMIQHSDVHDLVRKELGLPDRNPSKPIDNSETDNTWGVNDPDKPRGLFSKLKSFFGAKK